jgi:predicted Zn-dependent peptidase
MWRDAILFAAPGTSHVLETLAFGSTQKRSTAKLHRDLDDIGASAVARTGMNCTLIAPTGMFV